MKAPTDMKTIEMTLDSYREERAETDRMRQALESIAGWRNVNISGEPETSLRDIIRSITDCAARAIDN